MCDLPVDVLRPLETSTGRSITFTHRTLNGNIVGFSDDNFHHVFSCHDGRCLDDPENLVGYLRNREDPLPMTFDPTKPVTTRDGGLASILAVDLVRPDGRTIAARIKLADEFDVIDYFYPDGRVNKNVISSVDLINGRRRRIVRKHIALAHPDDNSYPIWSDNPWEGSTPVEFTFEGVTLVDARLAPSN
jgi:hypothetical protein